MIQPATVLEAPPKRPTSSEAIVASLARHSEPREIPPATADDWRLVRRLAGVVEAADLITEVAS